MKLSISYLSIKEDLKNKLNLLNNTTTNFIHVDIMDGNFVNNKTMDDLKQIELLKELNKPLDVHLMVEDVDKYIDIYKVLKPTYITFHIELDNIINILETIKKIKELGIKVGISLNPNTSIDSLKPYLEFIDLVLVMSVVPGMGGQTFIENTFTKLRELNDLKEKYNFKVEVDGGVNNILIPKLKEYNVDIVVVGSYITNSNNYQEKINELNI